MTEPTPGWAAGELEPRHLGRVPTGRFRPIARLLDTGDFAQLLLQPGLSKADARALKRERRAMLLAYLRDLRADSIAAWRLTSRARGHSASAVSAIRSRCRVEFAILHIAGNVMLHQAGYGRISGTTFQLTIELARLQLSALRSAY